MPSHQRTDETITNQTAQILEQTQDTLVNKPLTREEQSNKEVEYFRLLMETAGRRGKASQDGLVEEIHLLQKNGELGLDCSSF
jgi:hypothetical protein